MDEAERVRKLIEQLQNLEKAGKLSQEGARHLKDLLSLNGEVL